MVRRAVSRYGLTDKLGDGGSVLLLAICLCLPLQLWAGVPAGAVADPDIDALPSVNADPDPDVISASVTSDGTNLHLAVRFEAGTFDQALTRAAFHLDTDQNPGTGNPGTGNPGASSGCVDDADVLGADFVVYVGGSLGTDIHRGIPTCGASFTVLAAGAAATTFVADGMDALVPLALLDGDDGWLNFKVTISEEVSANSATGILDTIPDVGLPPGMSGIYDMPPAGPPVITGIFNAATFVPEGEPEHAVAPGSEVSIFGEGFASHLSSPLEMPLSSQQIPLSTSLGDLTATVDGILMPLFGIFRGEDSGKGFDQINGQIPWEVLATPEKTSATLIITSNGVSSEPREIWVAPASPGIYSWGFGPGPGIVTNFRAENPSRVEFAQSPGTFCAWFNLSPELCADTTASGRVTDPDNDALPSPREDPDPDVVSASVSSDGINLYLAVRFKAGTFDQAQTLATFHLDTDQDPGTGNPGTTIECLEDADILGTDYTIVLGGNLGTDVQIWSLPACGESAFVTIEGSAATFVTDGIDAVVPLALLGGDDGRLNFKVTIEEQISETGNNPPAGILDTMPDPGLPPGEAGNDIALHANGQPVVNEKVAKIGGIITLWTNGLGPFKGAVPSGGIPGPGEPLLAAKTVTVLTGGVEAQVLGAFLHSQFVALNQINAIVPEGVEPGDAVPIVIEVDCGDGNVFRSREDVTIAIASPEEW